MDPLQLDLATDILNALETSDWFYLASLALALATWFFRPKAAKIVPFFNTDRGGVAFVALLGAFGGVVHASVVTAYHFAVGLPVSNPFTPVLATTVAKVVGGAIATYVGIKKVWPESQVQTVEDAIKKAEERVKAENVGVEMTASPPDEAKVADKEVVTVNTENKS